MCLERFSLRRGISFSFLASEAAYVIISEARNLITDVGVRCAGETQHEGGWAAATGLAEVAAGGGELGHEDAVVWGQPQRQS